jgi:hypothetical protein
MLDLKQSLQAHDLGFLRIVAEFWGLELNTQDLKTSAQQLSSAMLDQPLVEEMIEVLPVEAREALEELLDNNGKLPWPLFTRRYGRVREMGAGRRDRQQPYLSPISPAEVLWYRSLISRHFFDTPTGLQEYAYIPTNLKAFLPKRGAEPDQTLGRPATPTERTHPKVASDRILDHICTLLAALRLGFSSVLIAEIESGWQTTYADSPYPPSITAIKALLSAAGLIDESDIPIPEPTRNFLGAPRVQALNQLAQTWLQSKTINDLRHIPGLQFEGEWENNPLFARMTFIDLINKLPMGKWWSLSAFIASIKQLSPDFQRPAGDYDSWYIRAAETDKFLRGFEYWDAVDGALVRYLICGPLHWLGFTDLASNKPDAQPTSFRFSAWAPNLLLNQPPENLDVEPAKIIASSDGQLHVSRLVPRSVRYQIARFSAWEGERDGIYFYRLKPATLESARQQGLRISQLLGLFRRHAQTVPPSLVKTLDRWDKFGTEVRLEQASILRVRTPEILQALQNSRAARFLGDLLGPTVIIVKPGSYEKVLAILVELGYMTETTFDM